MAFCKQHWGKLISSGLPAVQVTELTGLEAGELRAKVGSNVMDNTVISLTGSDIDLAPHLRHAGTFSTAVLIAAET